MKRMLKIKLFVIFLLAAHLAHLVEMSFSFPESQWLERLYSHLVFYLLSLVMLIILILVFFALLKHGVTALRYLRYLCVFYLTYGLILALANVYRQGELRGIFTAFLFVMIGLPLLLSVSDELKDNGQIDSPAT